MLPIKCPHIGSNTSNGQVEQVQKRVQNVPEKTKNHCIRSRYSKRENVKGYSSDEEDDEEDEINGESQPIAQILAHQPIVEATSTEWIGITTNSEECSYSSAENSESQIEYSENNAGEWDYCTPTVILNSSSAIGDRSKKKEFSLKKFMQLISIKFYSLI